MKCVNSSRIFSIFIELLNYLSFNNLLFFPFSGLLLNKYLFSIKGTHGAVENKKVSSWLFLDNQGKAFEVDFFRLFWCGASHGSAYYLHKVQIWSA